MSSLPLTVAAWFLYCANFCSIAVSCDIVELILLAILLTVLDAKLIAAQAEAKSMAIRAQALAQNKSLVQYEAVQKWDGKMPQYMLGNSVPFINVSAK